LIHNGSTTAQVGTAPWNVGIYLFNNESSKYDLICGGSLIAPNLVVSGKKHSCFSNLKRNDNLLIKKNFSGSLFLAKWYAI